MSNRKISANTFTLRLDLGTRSLANLAGANLGTTGTLRFRPVRNSHPGAFPRVGRMMQMQVQTTPSITAEKPETKPAAVPAGKPGPIGASGRGCTPSSSPGSSSSLAQPLSAWQRRSEAGGQSGFLSTQMQSLLDQVRADRLPSPRWVVSDDAAALTVDRPGCATEPSRPRHAASAQAYPAHRHTSRSARPNLNRTFRLPTTRTPLALSVAIS